jgi:hypothetical protein
MVASPKQLLHEMVDHLSDADVADTLAYVRWLVSEEAASYDPESAPFDDEPETDDERAAVARALEQLERGDTVPHAQVRRELGL